jgi:LAS superfamily LD-carboxypeptidase LdcB
MTTTVILSYDHRILGKGQTGEMYGRYKMAGSIKRRIRHFFRNYTNAFTVSVLIVIIVAAAAFIFVRVFRKDGRYPDTAALAERGIGKNDINLSVQEKTDEDPIKDVPAVDDEMTDDRFLILVNWNNPLPYDRPDDLVEQGELFGDEVILVNGEGSINIYAGHAAKRMFQDAVRAGICRYKLSSAYRSVSYQDGMWNERVKQDPDYGRDPFNEPVKVMPGRMSEHGTGLALDILSSEHENADDSYGETEEGMWLKDNAWRYGFILRYPKNKEKLTGVIYEPWHYRYAGEEAAKYIFEKGLCLEESIETTDQSGRG